jgi:hypothetical protein
MSNAQNVWWRPEGRSPFSLDPHRSVLPQIVSIAGQSLVIFGGPLLGLVGIQHYPPLVMDSTIYIVGASSIAFWFVVSFAFFGAKSFPAGMPKSMELMFRAGWGLCMTFLVVGIGILANGYGTPLISRDVAIVSKRPPHYVEVRAWPPLPTVAELPAPRDLYVHLAVPLSIVDTPQEQLAALPDRGQLRLIVGQGRLGLEWLATLERP